jgi:hypothetical protein
MKEITLILWNKVKSVYKGGSSTFANALLEEDFNDFINEVENLQKELLIGFLIHLNDKKLINNFDFDYEKEADDFCKIEKSKEIKKQQTLF